LLRCLSLARNGRDWHHLLEQGLVESLLAAEMSRLFCVIFALHAQFSSEHSAPVHVQTPRELISQCAAATASAPVNRITCARQEVFWFLFATLAGRHGFFSAPADPHAVAGRVNGVHGLAGIRSLLL
jgi:hypothetical protein